MRRARRTDPDTSKLSAKMIEHSLNNRQKQVLWYLMRRGPVGATDDEIETHFGHEELTTMRKRRTELCQKGLVLDSGRRDKGYDGSGRPKIRWVHHKFLKRSAIKL